MHILFFFLTEKQNAYSMTNLTDKCIFRIYLDANMIGGQ